MDLQESKVQNRYLNYLNKKEHFDVKGTTQRLTTYISGLAPAQREKILSLLKQVQHIQNSNSDVYTKSGQIKNILWTAQSLRSKLITGKISAIIASNLTFGTGRIEDMGLGSAYDVWGCLADKFGAQIIAGTIRNFE